MQTPKFVLEPNYVIDALNARLSHEVHRSAMLEAAVSQLQRDLAAATTPPASKVEPAE